MSATSIADPLLIVSAKNYHVRPVRKLVQSIPLGFYPRTLCSAGHRIFSWRRLPQSITAPFTYPKHRHSLSGFFFKIPHQGPPSGGGSWRTSSRCPQKHPSRRGSSIAPWANPPRHLKAFHSFLHTPNFAFSVQHFWRWPSAFLRENKPIYPFRKAKSSRGLLHPRGFINLPHPRR